jgi:nitrite transporter
MYRDTIDSLLAANDKKFDLLRRSPGGFLVSAMLAGAYVGIGILLIFTLGAQAPAEFRKLVMGCAFGIALTLVVIAGGELFTGYALSAVLAKHAGRATWADVVKSWWVSWIGNFGGCAVLVGLFALGGGGGLLAKPDTLLMDIASYKMNSSIVELFARAILCNWLVCLALWMSARVREDTAKCIVIFWCLLAFVACGFEHSVANMTLLLAALAGEHPGSVSVLGLGHNLLWVTLGNLVGGAVFVAGAYWIISVEKADGQRRNELVSSPTVGAGVVRSNPTRPQLAETPHGE